jgi:hypothetical protein
VRANRWWLALIYALATVVAQGMHDHGGGADETVAQHEAGCSDPRPHMAGHPSPESGHLPIDCPACQYRAEHHSYPYTSSPLVRPSVAVSVEASPAPARLPSIRIHSCRAPPRV